MKKPVATALLFAALTWCAQAFPLMGEHMAGFPVGRNPQWPEGLADVLNSPGRVYGFFDNFLDLYFFAGDTDDFNDLLKRYSKVEGIPLKLVLHQGQGKTGTFGRDQIPFDYELAMSFWIQHGKPVCSAAVGLWVGGEVELDKVEVPPNVVVETTVNLEDHQEIARFISDQKATRRRAEGGISSQTVEEPAMTELPSFKSKRPLFGKLALNEDGSKVLSVALDESSGTRTGHDVLYADLNFNGRFEQTERFDAASANRHGSWLASSSFPPLDMDVPYNKEAQGISRPCQLTSGYRQYPRHGVPEDLSVTVRFRLREGNTTWEYAFSGSATPSKRLDKATIWRPCEKPGLEITAKPDGTRKANLGVGLELTASENKLECWKEGQPVKAHVEIKKPDRAVAHRGDATPDKFTFG